MQAADGRRALRRGIASGLVAGLVSVAVSACGSSSVKPTGATASVMSAPVRIAHTRLGAVGYRVVGSGPPLVLIMGYGWTMEGWDPRLVHALARHNRVVMFDNSGVGRTQQLPAPLTIDAMADQTSALIADTDADMVGPMAAVRMRLFRTVPAVRGKALQVQMAAQQQIARELHAAFPGELDRVSAAAPAGAFTGAVSGALTALMDHDDAADDATPESAQFRAQVRQATEFALRPWRR